MARSDLNVRLGLELRNFERGLKQADRSLRRTAQNLQSIGSDLSVAVTAPILAAGGASLKAAAEFEQLQKALLAVTGDADEARAQLERLRKIAEAPGIGFEQAVAASLQFQGLGVSAGQAEEAIKQVANAVAASGGGADAFAGVVRQLNQIQAKNRVLQEDISILLENAPVLGNVLQDTFGAKTAEGIRAAGVNGEQFFEQLVKGLGTLNRVEGGLANTFENFGIAVRFALADIGQQLNELFNIQGTVDGFISKINQAVDIFRGLDDETKRSIVRFAAFAASVGPAIFVTSKLIGVFNTLRTVTLAVTKGVLQLFAANQSQAGAFSGLTAQVGRLAASWRALNTVQQAFIATGIGIALVAIASLVTVVRGLSSEYDRLTAATRASNEVMAQAEAQARLEISTTGALVSVITNETLSREQREKALDSLQQKYPQYFGNLNIEKSSIEDITKAYDNFKLAIVQVSRARAAENKLTELATREAELLAEQRRIEEDEKKTGFAGFAARTTGGAGKDALVLRTEENNKALETLAKERDAIVSIFNEANLELTRLESLGGDTGGSGGDAAAEAAKRAAQASEAAKQAAAAEKELAEARKVAEEDARVAFSKRLREFTAGNQLAREEVKLLEGALVSAVKPLEEFKSPLAGFLAQVNESVGDIRTGLAAVGGTELEIVSAQVDLLKSRLQQAAVAFGANSEAVQQLQAQLGPLQEELNGLTNQEALFGNITDLLGQLTEGFNGWFNTLLEGGKDAFKSFRESLKSLLAELAKAVLVAATLAVIFSLIGGGGFVANFAKAGIGGGGGLSNIIKLFGGGRFAQGGVVPPGYPSDSYPALLTSGEIVVPPQKLPDLAGIGGGQLTGEIRLAGNDLVIALERFQNNRTRTRGK